MKLPEYISKLLDEIAVSEGFEKYHLESNSGSNHGDNFLGLMIAVKVVGEREKAGKRITDPLNLLCKMKPISQYRNKCTLSHDYFSREIDMYTKVLPLLLKFQREKGLSESESFMSFPKVFKAIADPVNDHYVLIMEDLRPKHFRMWPKAEIMPLDHTRLVMKELGKLHAVSFALKDQQPELFKDFTELDDMVSLILEKGKFETIYNMTIDRSIEVIKNPEHKAVMQELRGNYRDVLARMYLPDTIGRFGVVSHGDCWNNNFIFQYEDDTMRDVCFLDWQLSAYCSPVLDIHYFIHISTNKEIRDAEFLNLLKLYHDSLSENIEKLGSDPEQLFSFADLKSEMKKYGKYALLKAPLLMLFMVAEKDDIVDLDEFYEKMSEDKMVPLVHTFNAAKAANYSQRVNDFIDDLYRFDCI